MRRHHCPANDDALSEERFGKPLQLVYVGGQHFPFYRQLIARPITYVARPGGGAIQDIATHMVSAAEWLVGPVTARRRCGAILDGTSVEDTVVTLLTRHVRVGSFR